METTSGEQRLQTICLLIIAFIGIGACLLFLKPVLVPFVLALFFTYLLAPVIDFQVRRLHMPRMLAYASTATIGLLALALVGTLLTVWILPKLDGFKDAPQQYRQFPTYVVEHSPLSRMGLSEEQLEQVKTWIDDTTSAAIGGSLGALASIVPDILSQGMLVAIFMLFILAGRPGKPRSDDNLISEIEQGVKRYINVMLMVSALTGILVGGVLAILGVRYAVVFGMLAFLLNFIPTIGSIIATLLPLPVILLSEKMGVSSKILAMVLPMLIQFGIGNVLAPKLLGDSLNLHAITVLLSLIFFGMIWGLTGALLAAPIAAVIRIVLLRIELTRPVANLLAGEIGVFDKPQPARPG